MKSIGNILKRQQSKLGDGLTLTKVWEDTDGSLVFVATDDRGRYLGNVYPEPVDSKASAVVWFGQDCDGRTSEWEDNFQTPEDAAMWLAIRSPYRPALEVA